MTRDRVSFLRLVHDADAIGEPLDHERELYTALIRRFLLIDDDEPIELTALVNNKTRVAFARNPDEHAQLLREAERIPGFNGCYMLVNGPLNRDLLYRYEPGRWHYATNGRATDKDVAMRRAVFVDVDPDRPKGISSTDSEKREAYAIAHQVRDYLAQNIGANAIGFGDSGNGHYLLIAVTPCPATPATTASIAKFLKLLAKKFGTDRVKIDVSVSNAARLMSCPGTLKAKGINSAERPHRRTAFKCARDVERVPLEVICG